MSKANKYLIPEGKPD